jgi:hypothetical protein
MSLKRTLATTLAILLAASPFPALSAAPQDPPASAPLAVALAPAVGCMVAGTNPQVEAGISPSSRVQAGRVYFKSALGDAFYYVEMTPGPAGYVGVLPKPRPDAGPITYYVEGVALDYAQSQTPEQSAVVVDKPEDCGTRPMAALGPADPVRVFSTTGGTALPPGFSGVSSVVAGGASAAGAAGAGAAAAAGGGGVFGTTGLIVAGAVALGVGTAVVISTGGEDKPPTPASPFR